MGICQDCGGEYPYDCRCNRKKFVQTVPSIRLKVIENGTTRLVEKETNYGWKFFWKTIKCNCNKKEMQEIEQYQKKCQDCGKIVIMLNR